MKEVLPPISIMEKMVEKLQSNYPSHSFKKEGTIQFHLNHEGKRINCFIKVDAHSLNFYEGITEEPTVSVKSSFYDWLNLAGGKLKPVAGVFTGRLKFKGDTSFFKVLPRKQLKNKVIVPVDPVTRFERNPVKYWEKPGKVVVLNASPRGEKGYTEFYLKPFIKGIEKHTEVEVVYLAKYKINPCKGCFSCWVDIPGECIYKEKDGHHKLSEKLFKAGLIVYAFPIYADGMPGILKNFFDRSVSRAYPYLIEGMKRVRHPRRYINHNHSMVIFSICAFFEKVNFKPVKAYFKALAHNRHTPVVAEIYRTTAVGLHASPFAYKLLNNAIASLEEAGEQLVLKGKINRRTLKNITKLVEKKHTSINKINEWWDENKESGNHNY